MDGRASLTVFVTDEHGDPMAGVNVLLRPVGDLSGASIAPKTDFAGRVRFDHLSDGAVSLGVWIPKSQKLWTHSLLVTLASGYRDTVRVYLASDSLTVPCRVP